MERCTFRDDAGSRGSGDDEVSKGYKDVAHMKKDTDLDPLRQREDFQKLIAELEGKGK
jgi:hypothetical protein